MNNKDQDIAYFISFCIEQYKKAKGLSGAEVLDIFVKFGVLDYLKDHFDILHTQSYQWLLEDIDFVWPDTLTALKMVLSVFTQFNAAAFAAGIGGLGLTGGDWIVLAIAALVLWCCDLFRKQLTVWYASLPAAGKTALVCGMGLLVLVFGMYGIGFDAQAFIYSSF